ncbi:MAG TPA: hypothetical protein VGJ41_09825 [Nocardioides sp.]
MTRRAAAANRALTRAFGLAVAAQLTLAVAVWFGWRLTPDPVAWVLAVALLVLAGMSTASLSGRPPAAVLGLLAGAPVVAGAAVGSYDAGRTPGLACFLLGLVALPLTLWWCLHSAQRNLGPPDPGDTTGLGIFE